MAAPAVFAAQASTAETNVLVRPGALSLTGITVSDFDAGVIDGTATWMRANLAFAVFDFRGSGAGWYVTARATRFAEYHDAVGSAREGATLAQDSLLMPAPEVSPVGQTTSPAPIVKPGPYAMDAGVAVTIASAPAGAGMGEHVFTTEALTLSLPSDVRAATYHSTVTIDLVSGP